MSDDQVAVILTKDVRDTHLDTEYLLVIGAEDGPSGLGASVAAGVSAFNIRASRRRSSAPRASTTPGGVRRRYDCRANPPRRNHRVAVGDRSLTDSATDKPERITTPMNFNY